MSSINPIGNMFADAVMTISSERGYNVHAEYKNGNVKEIGPYSKDTASLLLEDLSESPDFESGYLVNLDTGEIENELQKEVAIMTIYEMAESIDELGDYDFYEVFQDLGKMHGKDNVEDFIEWLKDVLEEIEEAQKNR